MKKTLSTMIATTAVAALFAASPATADIYLQTGTVANPGENVQFNNNGGAGVTGTTIIGNTNQTDTAVTYTSTTELHASGGQADITSSSGTGFSDLSWQIGSPAGSMGWTAE